MSAGQGYTLVYDIEVAGYAWEEVDEITRGYLMAREKDPEKRDAVQDRTALFPGLGKVVAIGVWLVEDDRGLLLLEGEPDGDEQTSEQDWAKVPRSKLFRGDERALLTKFWDIVTRVNKASRLPRLVTYNGRSYDGPTLMIRSAQLGIAARRDLVGYRYDISDATLKETYPEWGVKFVEAFPWNIQHWFESPKGTLNEASQKLVGGIFTSGTSFSCDMY